MTVKDLAGNGKERRFTYDYAMWSHDKFTTNAEGYNMPDAGGNYCDQAKAWELVGERMLNKAW